MYGGVGLVFKSDPEVPEYATAFYLTLEDAAQGLSLIYYSYEEEWFGDSKRADKYLDDLLDNIAALDLCPIGIVNGEDYKYLPPDIYLDWFDSGKQLIVDAELLLILREDLVEWIIRLGIRATIFEMYDHLSYKPKAGVWFSDETNMACDSDFDSDPDTGIALTADTKPDCIKLEHPRYRKVIAAGLDLSGKLRDKEPNGKSEYQWMLAILGKSYTDILSGADMKRIATVLNWKPDGGAPPTLPRNQILDRSDDATVGLPDCINPDHERFSHEMYVMLEVSKRLSGQVPRLGETVKDMVGKEVEKFVKSYKHADFSGDARKRMTTLLNWVKSRKKEPDSCWIKND